MDRSGSNSISRRVIFPSLHGISQRKTEKKTLQTVNELTSSPKTVLDAFCSSSTEVPALVRSNSLDRGNNVVPLSVPILPINEAFDGEEHHRSRRPRRAASTNVNRRLHGLNLRDSLCIRTQNGAIGKNQSAEKIPHGHPASMPRVGGNRSQPHFGERQNRRTFYPPATRPMALQDTKQPSKKKPLRSILRHRANTGRKKIFPCRLPSTSPDLSSVVVPTLASPNSIRSLHSSDSDRRCDSESDSICETESDVERISDSAPKVIPRTGQKLRSPGSHPKLLSEATAQGITQPSESSRHASFECLPNHNKAKFDPQIQVYEYTVTPHDLRDKWFTEAQLAEFKEKAIHRIRMRSLRVIPTGTGRAISANFANPALSSAVEFETDDYQDDAASREMRNILIVDNHQVFLRLFTKSLNHMLPQSSVATAQNAEECLVKIEAAQSAIPDGATQGFDVIVIEERLRGSFGSIQHLVPGELPPHATQPAGDNSTQGCDVSGSKLIQYICRSDKHQDGYQRFPLIIGVSAQLEVDRPKLLASGADMIWGKPPPQMNKTLRDEMLAVLLKKRGEEKSGGEDI